MAIIAKNIIVGTQGPKKKEAIPPAPVQNFNSIKNRIVRNVPFEEKVEEKTHYETIKEGDLEKLHNTKSHYLNDMTGFKF